MNAALTTYYFRQSSRRTFFADLHFWRGGSDFGFQAAHDCSGNRCSLQNGFPVPNQLLYDRTVDLILEPVIYRGAKRFSVIILYFIFEITVLMKH